MERQSRKGAAPKPLRDRILASISVTPEGCWEWQKSLTPLRYGQIWLGSRADGTRRKSLAHRAVYEEYVGPIPEGLPLDHLCRNPPCVNPAHLEPVTQRVNILRGSTLASVNAAKTHCPQGHQYTAANTYVAKSRKRYCRACRRAQGHGN